MITEMRNPRSITRSPSPAGQRGMSLIEIIIVIVLIGAVLAFVGNRVLGGKDRGDYNLAKGQVQTLAGKIDSFQMDTGRRRVRSRNWSSSRPTPTGGWGRMRRKPS
jgi:general secretion pathway protein G